MKVVIFPDIKLVIVEIIVSLYNMTNIQKLQNAYSDAKMQNSNTDIQLEQIHFIHYFHK